MLRTHRARRLVAVLATLGAATSLVGPASAVEAYDAGLSSPVEDSYYPTKGDPGIDALHYDLNLRWLKAPRRLEGVATIDLRATEDAQQFQLDLAHSLQVSGVTVDGAPATFTHRRKTLVVGSPVLTEQRVQVVVTYAGTPKPVHAPTHRGDFDGVGMNVTRRGDLWTMQEPFGAFTWYPVNDQPSDKALYDFTIDTTASQRAVANGLMTSETVTGDRRVSVFHLRDPAASYLTTLAVGDFVTRHLTGPHGLPISIWLPRSEARRLMRPMRFMPADLRWLEQRLGRYPFESAGAVSVASRSAMETQTMVTTGDFGRGTREVTVHELAHQWYGDTVTPRDWRDVWMSEGMAMYVEGRWSAEHTNRTWKSWVRTFCRYDQLWRDLYGPPGAYDRSDFGEVNIYYGPACMYEQLRKKVGTGTFNATVKSWTHDRANSNQGRRAYVRYWERHTGQELSRFFRTWLMSQKTPRH